MTELGLGAPETRASSRHVRRRRSHGVLATVVALGIVVGLLGGAAYLGRDALSGLLPGSGPEDFPGPGTGEVVIQVASGDTVSAIGRTLESSGVVASSEAFVDIAEGNPASTGIQPGSYSMREEMSAAGALDVLVDPANRIVRTVALPEGLRLDESFARLAEGSGLPVEAFQSLAQSPGALGLPAYAENKLEGFVFPATYEFEPEQPAEELLAITVARFAEAAAAVRLEERATALRITPLEAVTIASIIEAETTRPEDMARVARVIYNRLSDGMRLQMDSTVHYVVGDTGSVFTTDAERAVDSPYNTYRVSGLPPGPIGSPGQIALEAALNPAAGEWRYFVTVDLETGETRFAQTQAEHDANVAVLQAYCRTSDVC